MTIVGFSRTVSLAIILLAAGCQQLTSSRVAVDYYAISGNSTAKLDREIRRKGPKVDGGRHAVAVARIRMIPNIRFARVAGGCVTKRTQVNVDAKVTLPRWTGRARASKKLGKAWDNIDRYTRAHEAVHVAIAFRYARLMENEIKSLGRYRTCESLKAKTNAIVSKRLAEHDQAQKAFDAEEQRRLSRILRSDSSPGS